MDLSYYTWELFTMDEKNAWWLMMVVFALTCITFIYTNVKMRVHLQKIEGRQSIIMSALYIMVMFVLCLVIYTVQDWRGK